MNAYYSVRQMTAPRTRRLRPSLWLLLLLAGLLLPSKAQATQQSLAQIQTTVKQFVQQHIARGQQADIQLGALDPRLRLAACDQSLSPFFPHGRSALGNTTVGIRCRGSRPWTLYVPVKVSLYAMVLVAAQPLQGYFTDNSQVIGRTPMRPLAAGSVLTPRNLPAPRLVQRGDTVLIMVKNPRFEVRMQGEALANGAKGDRIKVRNLLSRKIIQGEVLAKGVIQVN